MAKRAPCVDIRTDALKDERFEVLSELGGYNRFEAIGRMFALWAWCHDRGLKDAPDDSDGYAVSEAIVRRFLGPDGVKAILADGCDELALGAARDVDGLIYLKGTSDYVAVLRARRVVAVVGGRARATAARTSAGRFAGPRLDECTEDHEDAELDDAFDSRPNVSPTTIDQPPTTRTPAGDPADNQPTPASSSSSSSSSSQIHRVFLDGAEADPSYRPSGDHDREDPHRRGPIAAGERCKPGDGKEGWERVENMRWNR